MKAPISAVLSLAFLLALSLNAQAQYQKAPAGDVEYNATERSPTLPLVQTPPPQNSPNSVYVGQPNYYYYTPTYGGGGYGYGSGYGPGYGPQVGGIITNTGSQSRRTFWFNTPIPGQVAPSPSYGGPGYYGPGYFPYAGSNGVFIP